ncbi:hypothetical protein BGX21_007903, partial [Mortierella sp. AD011]
MELTSIGSVNGDQKTGPARNAWAWAIKNKWAERTQTKNGPALLCLFPGCTKTYAAK